MNEKDMQYIYLTRDLVPILYFPDRMDSQAMFACPLPLHYKEAIQIAGRETILEFVLSEMNKINDDAFSGKYPFQNFIVGIYGKVPLKRSKHRELSRMHLIVDETRGLAGFQAGMDVQSGDVYLSEEHAYFPSASGFSRFFNFNAAFHCHNVDYYWQALLTRELCVRYFNFLVKILMDNEERLMKMIELEKKMM